MNKVLNLLNKQDATDMGKFAVVSCGEIWQTARGIWKKNYHRKPWPLPIRHTDIYRDIKHVNSVCSLTQCLTASSSIGL